MIPFRSTLCFLLLVLTLGSCTKEVISPNAEGINTGSNPSENGSVATPSFFDDEPVIIRGHVKNISGNSIVGAGVQLFPEGESVAIQSTQTDTQGAYLLPDSVDRGNYNLRLSANGYVTKTVFLQVDTDINRTDTLQTQ